MSARKGALPYAGASDTGLVRSGNEDYYVVQPPLFAVADGLGGHQAGEVASQNANEPRLGNAPRRADAKALGRAVRSANAAVIEAAVRSRSTGMGTTLTSAMVEGTRIAIAHVGDSRAYLLHLGELTQLTQDHSMVGRHGARRNAPPRRSRACTPTGASSPARLARTPTCLSTCSRSTPRRRPSVLCSDGLTCMVEDAGIEEVLQTAPSPTPRSRG